MNRIMVVTGGEKNRETYDKWCENVDYIIGVDGGALWLANQELKMDLAIGDFDTVGERGVALLQSSGIELISFSAEKNMTDTQLAVEHAVSLGAKEIILFGGVGSRFDHSLANVQLMWHWHQKGVQVKIIDSFHYIQHVERSLIIDQDYPFISLLPFSPKVEGIFLKGFKYPLEDATLSWGDSLGISNELIEPKGTITIRSGSLLVVQTKDT